VIGPVEIGNVVGEAVGAGMVISERLKRIKERKDIAKTRFMGFSVKKQGFQGLICKKPGAKT
jgi:hypothetical protein